MPFLTSTVLNPNFSHTSCFFLPAASNNATCTVYNTGFSAVHAIAAFTLVAMLTRLSFACKTDFAVATTFFASSNMVATMEPFEVDPEVFTCREKSPLCVASMPTLSILANGLASR